MRIYLYKSFLEKKPENSYQNVFFLKNFNYIALLLDNFSLNPKDKTSQIRKLKEELKLKAKELSQKNFLKLLIKDNINIEKITFQNSIDDCDKEAIKTYLSEKQYQEIVNEIKNDEDYYLINSIEIFLNEFNMHIILEKNLEMNIISKSFKKYTSEELLNLFSDAVQISEILKTIEGD